MTTIKITDRNLEHPGASDATYRARRDDIATIVEQNTASSLPTIAYTTEEHATWSTMSNHLQPLHKKFACSAYLRSSQQLAIPTDQIPQLNILAARLRETNGFRLMATTGLLDAKTFLLRLGERTMSCTQYIRHASRPDYTPEPDIAHEVVGHIPLFMNKEFVEFSTLLGRAATLASDEHLLLLERLYWFTIEFGLIEEHGKHKAFGAGLLSSFGELPHALSPEVEHRPFSAAQVAMTDYVFTDMQPTLFVVTSFEAMKKDVQRFLASLKIHL